jgi:four helix bundle protein
MDPVDYGSYGQDIRDRSFRFACRIVEFCKRLVNDGGVARILAPQLLRCGTSVGANLEEARGGESRRDFLSKCRISLKEARESAYRLRILVATKVGPPKEAADLGAEASEIAAILGAIVRNTRRNASL